MSHPLGRRLFAELLGSAYLAAIVIGSGIAAAQLSPGDVGLELLENALATAMGLFAIILMFGPVSGAHFNPVVSLVDAAFGGLSRRDALAYIPFQITGCILGAMAANVMFAQALISISTKHRASPAHLFSEVIATLGLMLVIFSLARTRRGAEVGIKGAIVVDRQMRTNLPDVLAAGDCVVTHHPLLGTTYLPLGTTAHKQGRIAGENALGGTREFAGSLGTQVVKVFDLVAARTGLRDHEAATAGLDPFTVAYEADDHKAYYPGSHKIAMRYTGDRRTGQLLGVQLVGHLNSEIAKRIDIPATAIFNRMTVEAISDLDLSYTPPLGSPWDALQHGAQAWTTSVSRPSLRIS